MSASIVNPVTVSNEREIQPMDLPVEQLSNLKAQHEEEIRELQKQLESLASNYIIVLQIILQLFIKPIYLNRRQKQIYHG